MKTTSRFILVMFIVGVLIVARLYAVPIALALIGAFILGVCHVRLQPPPSFVAVKLKPDEREAFMREWEEEWAKSEQAHSEVTFIPEPPPRVWGDLTGLWRDTTPEDRRPQDYEWKSSLPPPRIPHFDPNAGQFET